MIFNNGDIYQGDWVDSKSQGHGIFTSEDCKYKGEWFWDQREGFGTCIWEDGTKYTGEWYNDQQHGKVAFIDSQGNQVIGEYVEGELVFFDSQGNPLVNNEEIDDNPFAVNTSPIQAKRTGEPETGHILAPLAEKKNE